MNPLRQSAFAWFFAGRAVSLLGSAMAPIALAFAVLGASHKTSDLSIVLAARSVPLVAFLLLGGAFADRFSRSTVLQFSNIGAAITQAAVAAILLLHAYDLTTISALEIVNGTLTAFTTPAMRGIVPELVDRGLIQRANALLGSSRNAATIIGPTVAGVLVASVGGAWAIAVDAGSFAFASLCMARLDLPRAQLSRRSSLFTEMREGWSEFHRRNWVWIVVASVGVTNCVRTGVWSVLGPTIALRTFGAASWGVVLSARALGLLVMSFVMYRVVVKRLLAFGQGFLLLGALPLIVLGVEPNVYLLFVASFASGIGSGVFAPAWEISLQQRIPTRLLSRITAYDDTFSYIAVPVGQVAVGPLAVAFGASQVAVWGGLIFLAATALPLAFAAVREPIDATSPPEEIGALAKAHS